jgi:hypothetical protein
MNVTEQQYQSLCDACDQVLQAPESTLTTTAIPWLHVIREHPVFLSKYQDLFMERKSIYPNPFILGLRSWISNCRQIFRSFTTSSANWISNKPLPNCVDVLFVTHLVNKDHATNLNDFYFGHVPLELSKLGYSVAIAYVNMTQSNSTKLIKDFPSDQLSRVILTKSLSFSKELSLIINGMVERKRLGRLMKVVSKSFLKRVLLRASKEATSPGTYYSLRVGKQVASLIAKTSARSLIVIHEGHSWERVVFASAREARNNVRCIAYQHAILYRLQHAIFAKHDGKYTPDQIIASGISSFARLSNGDLGSKVKIRLGGSVRAPVFLRLTQRRNNKVRLRCLVLPEGIMDECDILYSFAMACATYLPDVEFVIRLHPVVSFKKLSASFSKKGLTLPNIILSDRSFSDDLMNCDYALYRGSSAIIGAVGARIIPVYVARPNEISIDPLFELACYRVLVTEPKEFLKIINGVYKFEESDYDQAITACKRLYSPLNIDEFVRAIT